jgi:hypothetical protein
MMKSLKTMNQKALVGTLVFHGIFAWFAYTGTWVLAVDSWLEALKRFSLASPFAIVLGVVAFLFQGMLSSDLKARIMFLRFRGNPYPGAQAFTKWLASDSRIDAEVIRQRHGPLPEDPDSQNALWYRLLKRHEGDSGIADAHRRYLLARDLATDWLLFGVASVVIVLILGKSATSTRLAYAVLNVLVLLVMLKAAQNYGISLVTNTLAIECTKESGGET